MKMIPSPMFVMVRIPQRLASGLSLEEWIVMEHIFFIQARNDSGSAETSIRESIAHDYGWSLSKTDRVVAELVYGGWIRKISRFEYRTTAKWNQLISTEVCVEEIDQHTSMNDFFEEIEKEYPRKDFSNSYKKKLVNLGITANRVGFISAIKNYKKTKDAANGFCMTFAAFLDKWEGYKDGVPEGVVLADGTISSGKKIANGAAALLDNGFKDFYKRCYQFAINMDNTNYEQKAGFYESGEYILDGQNFFSEKEYAVIEIYGGLKRIALEGFNDDFSNQMGVAWNIYHGGVM